MKSKSLSVRTGPKGAGSPSRARIWPAQRRESTIWRSSPQPVSGSVQTSPRETLLQLVPEPFAIGPRSPVTPTLIILTHHKSITSMKTKGFILGLACYSDIENGAVLGRAARRAPAPGRRPFGCAAHSLIGGRDFGIPQRTGPSEVFSAPARYSGAALASLPPPGGFIGPGRRPNPAKTSPTRFRPAWTNQPSHTPALRLFASTAHPASRFAPPSQTTTATAHRQRCPSRVKPSPRTSRLPKYRVRMGGVR